MDEQSFWASIGKFLFQLFINKENEKKDVLAPTELSVSIPIDGEVVKKPEEKPAAPNMEYLPETAIDWESPTCNITQHFLVGDAITLHSWNRLANESDGLTDDGKAKLVTLCNKMEEIRKILGCPVNVHCMYRSADYNKLIGANLTDPHNRFMACDFDCNPYITCDGVKERLLPKLEELGIRMENNGDGASWIHVDLCAVIHNRYFIP